LRRRKGLRLRSASDSEPRKQDETTIEKLSHGLETNNTQKRDKVQPA
jgi:hypothetical protein